ncbi:hypothetical protein PCC7424_1267 [Gloeothece citriformis PCC 7424]|uniref:Uncharacterized protein n=1 Tax=Gloeothece citriformis (strain PCC 7424) TaxID=65393 RepID=B7K7E6_GLOC7|nr:hypothetical protein [Gloeothece citriformis]ACK69714.1 hypothetical protein PCC7424_1267 [Gloeothece citriformis PCC 7424]
MPLKWEKVSEILSMTLAQVERFTQQFNLQLISAPNRDYDL